jgi:biotin carboxyl carrier protein
MKLQFTIDGENGTLDLRQDAESSTYRLHGAVTGSGKASMAEIAPGVFSVLLNQRSFTVHLAPSADGLEVWIGGTRYIVSTADLRDRSAKLKKQGGAGPVELHAQMPGKVVKLLVGPGASVQAGEGLVVVEAMKMQNQMKSPKDGTVTKIYVKEGAAVAAGERLMIVE